MPVTRPDVHDVVRRFISETFFVDDVGDDAMFLEEGIVNSTGMLELVLFVEATFGIPIADAELVPENFNSLDRLAAFVGRKLEAA